MCSVCCNFGATLLEDAPTNRHPTRAVRIGVLTALAGAVRDRYESEERVCDGCHGRVKAEQDAAATATAQAAEAAAREATDAAAADIGEVQAGVQEVTRRQRILGSERKWSWKIK